MKFSSTMVFPESEKSLPTGSTSHPLPSNEQIFVTLMIRRPASLKDHVDGIINGTSEILSHEQFAVKFSMNNTDLSIIEEFANVFGLSIDESHASSSVVILCGNIANFNSAFGVTLSSISINDRTYMSYVGSIRIPTVLDGIIEHIIGLDDSLVLTHHAVIADPENIASYVGSVPLTPIQVSTAYNFPSSDGYGESVAILELGGGYTSQNLTSSFSLLGRSPPVIIDVLIDGATNTPNDVSSVEVMLDIFVVGGIVPSSKIVVYFAPNSLSGFINALSAAIHDTTNHPSVVSISWGANESAWGSSTTAFDSVLQSAAILGITVCVSSGDYGSSADGNLPYTVVYPGSSSYVLSCGGTNLQLNTNGTISNEISWNSSGGSSGGGISSVYTNTSWQTGLTATKITLPSTTSVISLTGRGLPDVSGNGDGNTGYTFYCQYKNQYNQYVNTPVTFGGTSAVSPLYAGLIARLNLLTGKRLGFANVLFYSNSSIFRDIISGNNANPLSTGYTATIGWDACTGLGSPIGTSIYKILNTGMTFPKLNNGFRVSGQVYPRRKIRIS